MAKQSKKAAAKQPPQRTIYNRIKACLALKRVKGKELADHLDVSEQTVSKWATNYSQPSVPQLYAIAAFLGVGLMELLEPPNYAVGAARLRDAATLNEPET